jgi:hypothetical protein
MAAADFWWLIPAPHDPGSPNGKPPDLPGYYALTFTLISVGYTPQLPCKYRALHLLACSPHCVASHPLAVRQSSALPPASSRSHLAMDTLAVRLTLPLAGCVEDSHLLVSAPCRAHQINSPAAWQPGEWLQVLRYRYLTRTLGSTESPGRNS